MSSVESAPVGELIALVKMGGDFDDEAFAELVRRYTPLINKKVSSYFSQNSDIDEAIQEAQIALHSAAMTYDSDKCDGVTFGLYAGVCISNRLKSLLRQHKRDDLGDIVSSDKLAVGVDVEGRLARKEFCERVMNIARGILSDFEYRVFVLLFDGYPTREIAARLEREPKSVDNAKARISRRLRENREICEVLADFI